MRIGMDLDDVGYPFMSTLRYAAQAMCVDWIPTTLPDPTCWDFWKEDWGWTPGQFAEVLQFAVDHCGMYAIGRPAPGFREMMQQLKADGHSIHIVSDRARFAQVGRAVAATQCWLVDNDIPFDSMTFGQDKTIAAVDLHLDDAEHHYHAMRKAGVECFLWETSANLRADVVYEHQVSNFSDFLDYVNWRQKQKDGVAA